MGEKIKYQFSTFFIATFDCQRASLHCYPNLVGGLEHFLFFHILGIIIPLIFFRVVETTNQLENHFNIKLTFINHDFDHLLVNDINNSSKIQLYMNENGYIINLVFIYHDFETLWTTTMAISDISIWNHDQTMSNQISNLWTPFKTITIIHPWIPS